MRRASVVLAVVARIIVPVVAALAAAGGRPLPAAADPAPTRSSPRRLTSAALRAVRSETGRQLASLRRAAPGRRWIRDPGGDRVRVGRTYEEQVWRLSVSPAEAAVESLVAVMRAALRPDPDDEAFYARAGVLARPDAEALAGAFHIEHELSSRETAAQQAYLRELARAAARHPEVSVFSAQCGWGDTVGSAVHGVMVLDTAAGEVLWLHVDDVWSEG